MPVLYVGDTNSNPLNKSMTDIRHWCVEAGRAGRALFPEGAHVLLDSGAFPDVKRGRVTFEEALSRQLSMEERSGWIAQTLVSYDLLIDEVLDPNGNQRKERWSEGEGWRAVDVTIAAAKFLSGRREQLSPRSLCLSCQGVTPDQYEACAKEILSCALPGDVFGFGGWCILGQQRWRMPDFMATIERTIPLVAAAGLTTAHVFGVAWSPAVRAFSALCHRHGIEPTFDTTRFYLELTRGYQFDPQRGASVRVSKKNICSHEKATENISTAYRWFSEIDDAQYWGSRQESLFA